MIIIKGEEATAREMVINRVGIKCNNVCNCLYEEDEDEDIVKTFP